jgi:cytochrome P450
MSGPAHFRRLYGDGAYAMEPDVYTKLSSSEPSASGPAARRQIADLDGPRGWPLVGNLAQLDVPRLHAQLEAWARRHGPLYRLRLLRRDALVVARPDLIARVLRDRPEGWRRQDGMQSVLREMGIYGVFAAEGEAWKRQRRLVMAAFDPTHLKTYFPLLMQVTERLKKRLDAAARSGESIDLQTILMRYTVDVTAGLAFGIDMNTQEEPANRVQSNLDKIFPMLQKRINMSFPLWRYIKLPADRRFDRHLAAVHAAVSSFVRQARERMERNPDLHASPTNLLEAMLAARDDAGGSLTEEELTGNVLTMLLAGEDTTANTLGWTLYHLHTHREAWREMVGAVDRVLGQDQIPGSFQITRELDEIEHCANESMRLSSVAPVFFMQNNQATELGGIELPAGSFVICLLRYGAIDAHAAADAAEYRPARWRQPMAEAPANGGNGASRGLLKASMPFGYGPRMCPGRYLSVLEMKMVLATLARNYDLVEVGTEDGTPPQEQMAFTMFPVGLRMKLKIRRAATLGSAQGVRLL